VTDLRRERQRWWRLIISGTPVVALRHMSTATCESPHRIRRDWCKLYSTLIAKLRSRECFVSLRTVSGHCSLFGHPGLPRAYCGRTIGMTIWMLQVTLRTCICPRSPRSYGAGGASYALMWHAWDFFTSRVAWLSLGGVADPAMATMVCLFSRRAGVPRRGMCTFAGASLTEKKYDALAADFEQRSSFRATVRRVRIKIAAAGASFFAMTI